MKRIALLVLILVFVAACQPAAQDEDALPTLAELPSETPTDEPTDTPEPTETPTDTDTPEPTDTPTETNTPAATSTATLRPTNTPTNTATVDPTVAAIGTATSVVEEAPSFATLTPAPDGENLTVRPTSTGTPEIVADVIITERQFQEEVDRLLFDNTSIELADINFVPGGVEVELRALGGEAFTVGTVLYEFRLEGDESAINNFLIIQPVDVDEFEMETLSDEEDVPQGFVDVAYGDMILAILEAFDFILNQRLGEGQHDLEFITVTDDVIAVTLFVPES